MTYPMTFADIICDRLAAGQSLRSICDEEGMPDERTVRRWLREDEDFRRNYARAREEQADAIFEECLAIADEAKEEAIQSAKLRIDTRKWMAGKLRPKKYGEKLDIEAKLQVEPIEAVILVSKGEK